MPHMTTYGDQMDRKWTGSVIKPSVCPSRSGPEVSVCLSVRPKHFPYLLDEHYARELQAQGACALRFLFLGNNNFINEYWHLAERLHEQPDYLQFLIDFVHLVDHLKFF